MRGTTGSQARQTLLVGLIQDLDASGVQPGGAGAGQRGDGLAVLADRHGLTAVPGPGAEIARSPPGRAWTSWRARSMIVLSSCRITAMADPAGIAPGRCRPCSRDARSCA
jgi:hypothetical protein